MTDRPTGPATAAEELVIALGKAAEDEIRAAERARILAALPEALELANGGGHLEIFLEEARYGEAAEDLALALAAAYLHEPSREPGEEG